jgi:hypothetical protein
MKHAFVDFIPDKVEPNTLYIALEYDTAVHLCACGCGNEVVTPLSPAQWAITYDGRSVSLSPSIGNWSYPCLSHYWIEKGQVRWASKWAKSEIDVVRRKDAEDSRRLFEGTLEPMSSDAGPNQSHKRSGFWQRLARLFGR